MDQPFEEILEQALAEMKTGVDTEQVLNRYVEYADELRPLLAVASLGFSMPKNEAPAPYRRQKFAEKTNRFAWLHFAGLMRWSAVPLSLLLIILGGHSILAAADRAQPASRLYSIKRAAENLQVSLTPAGDKQIALQLELTQRRLDELQQASNSQDPAQEAAALTELQNQTQKTFAIVPQVAAAKALSNDPALLNSLVAISKQQKDIVSAIVNKPKPETAALAATSLTEVEKNRKSLALIVATVQEQSLADLKHKISVTGNATVSADKTKIYVDNTVFVIDNDTIISTSEGDTVTAADLPAKTAVTVVGSKEDGSIIAKVVTIVVSDDTASATKDSGDVKGVTTTKPGASANTENKPAIIPVKKIAPPVTTPPVNPEPTQEQSNKKANEVTTGYIVDSPTAQYSP